MSEGFNAKVAEVLPLSMLMCVRKKNKTNKPGTGVQSCPIAVLGLGGS